MGFRYREQMDMVTDESRFDESQWAVHLDLHNNDRFGHKAWPIGTSPFMWDTNEKAVAESDKIIKALPRLKWQMVEYKGGQWWWKLYDPGRKNARFAKGQPVLVSTKGYDEESDCSAALSKVIRHIGSMHKSKHRAANDKMKAKEERKEEVRYRRQLSRAVPGDTKGFVEKLTVKRLTPPKKKARK